MPNGTYGGVRGEKFTKNYPLLDWFDWKRKLLQIIFIWFAKVLNISRIIKKIPITTCKINKIVIK
jgi:hypothetical protein